MKYERKSKSDWSAKWIWAEAEESSKNVWLCFNKTVFLGEVPQSLTACIAAENKYVLYINGEFAIRDGGIKRGPTPTDCYYDEVDIAPFLKVGENLISVHVWYWGKDQSFSSTDAGQGGLLFEAIGGDVSVISDNTWKVKRDPAFKEDHGVLQPNFRLPESNIYYDAREEMCNWNACGYDFSDWENAAEYDIGSTGLWGKTYRREIPMFKDFGLKDYDSSIEGEGSITLKVPYNAHITPYLKVDAVAGKEISITTENTAEGSLHSTYVTKDGLQEFESPLWFNGERITYTVPEGVRVISLKYRESGYATEFRGDYRCSDEQMNTLWQKSLRTLYVTMRDTYMDCPDRERAPWWGDATNEMMLSMYSLDEASYLLYRKGVSTMLGHVDPETKVLLTVVPTKGYYSELPMQQLAGICGFFTYYRYTADEEFLRQVISPSFDYLDLWDIGEDGFVTHRSGSWDWPDWGDRFDVPVLENAWYYYAMKSVLSIAEILGDREACDALEGRMAKLYGAYQKLWCGNGYKSSSAEDYDDRGNAVAVLAGLCPEEHYGEMRNLLFDVRNSSPYMEYYVLEALCKMGEYELAKRRICERYHAMIAEDYSTLWELWDKSGTMNHAWSGGPLVIMSKHFAGITPLLPGYRLIGIDPRYSLDIRMSCTVPAVIGEIKLSYTTENCHTNIEVVIPEGAHAIIHLPENGAALYINGQKVFDDSIAMISTGVEYDCENRIIVVR